MCLDINSPFTLKSYLNMRATELWSEEIPDLLDEDGEGKTNHDEL